MIRRLSRVLLVLIAAQFAAAPVQGNGGFVITRATTSIKNGEYFLNAQVDYDFSKTALEALDNGVPLTIEMRIQIRSQEAWLWERSLVDFTQLYLIRYQPLSELYRVTRLPDGPRRTFVTRSAAIATLGEIEDLPLVKRRKLEPGEHYFMHIKVALDIEALPLPLRPTAYLKPSWNLSSGWTQWPLEP